MNELVEKYLGEAKKGEYIHIVDGNDGWEVMHSTHDHPRMGGQVMKTLKDGKAAMAFARKMFSSIKGVKVWKQSGMGASAKWSENTKGGMNKIFQQ